MKKILVFGVFDGVHEGHRAFLRQVRIRADGTHKNAEDVQLIVAVARDEVVEVLKGKRPRGVLEARMREVKETGLADEVVAGDARLGTWEVIGKHEPDVIALGYDQERLRAALTEFIRAHDLDIEMIMMEAHEPEKYHSSLLNDELT